MPDSPASPWPSNGNPGSLPEIEDGQDHGWHEPPRPRRDLIGRPSLYTPELADRIAERLADGLPLARLCLEPGMPSAETVRRWRLSDPDFDALFRFAQTEGWIELAHEVVRDVDAALDAGVSVERARLMFDVRRWMLARQAPEFFGSGRAKLRRERMRGR